MKLITVLITIELSMAEYCLYGDSPDCAFECHCAVDTECGGSGVCTSGCDQTGITPEVKRSWTGNTCQIGNIASMKPANQTSNYSGNNIAGNAVDGKTSGQIQHCSITRNSLPKSPGQWWLDLGGLYKIYNITIYSRKDCCKRRSSYINITVIDDNHRETECSRLGELSDDVINLPCHTPLVGRYVHISRYDGKDINFLTMCETIVTGHKYIDCAETACPAGVACDDVTGCSGCIGTYSPYCKTGCDDGLYGTNCKHSCVNCAEGTVCDNIVGCQGGCTDGFYGAGCNLKCESENCLSAKCSQAKGTCPECKLWWGDPRCRTPITLPEYKNERINEVTSTHRAITLTWQSLISVPDNLTQYYQYTVRYKEQQASGYTDGPSTPHSGDTELTATVRGLDHNTEYDLIIVPQRVMRGHVEAAPGTHYGPQSIETNCVRPDLGSVTIEVSQSSEDGNNPPKVAIHLEMLSKADYGCDSIQNVSVQYQGTYDDHLYTVPAGPVLDTYIIHPTAYDRYVVNITVTNNHNLSSTKSEYVTLVDEAKITAIVVSIIMVLLAGAALAAGVMWHRRRKLHETRSHILVALEDKIHRHCSTSETMGMSASQDVVIAPNLVQNTSNRISTNSAHAPEEEESLSNRICTLSAHAPEEQESLSNRMSSHSAYASGEEESLYENSAVGIEQFESYVARRKANADDFMAEYKTLPKDDRSRCQTGQTVKNKPRNRFKNIYPYDETRVKLKNNKDDYINGNYITGYDGGISYIATQGPLLATCEDFWQMIWQENVNTIVMVANLIEDSKDRCCEYWPRTAGKMVTFGNFIVSKENDKKTADYTTTILSVRCADETRNVRHFHFITWVDKNEPLYGATSLLAFFRHVNDFQNLRKGPMVVHCSAGVGRTGTFIALHILLQQVVNERKVDVYGWVKRLRGERMTMVQTMKQYAFTHEVLVEFIKSKDWAISCKEFTLKENDLENDTHSRKQFDLVRTMNSITIPNSVKDGRMRCNIDKNRNRDVIPADSDRPHLSGSPEDTYINAVYVDSFRLHEHIIVTQMPLPHTISDFWRLIHKQRTQIIIMLNQIKEGICAPYWPTDGSVSVTGGIDVTLTKTTQVNRSILVRDFHITTPLRKGEPSDIHKVRQFHLLSWPEDTVLPPDPRDLLDFINTIDSQDLIIKDNPSENSGAILVHCLDGVKHSGLFCALKYMLDKMKQEQHVDPYLAVRSVSRHRAEFFQTIDQYHFLYKMATEKLFNENQYVNFP